MHNTLRGGPFLAIVRAKKTLDYTTTSNSKKKKVIFRNQKKSAPNNDINQTQEWYGSISTKLIQVYYSNIF